jgi:hybrid cluster-associated redox disulfide protein
MPNDKLDDLTLDEIMRRWPRTIRVFVDWHLHCVGCPIADFHCLADSAEEHGYQLDDLRTAVRLAIDTGGISSAGPPPRRPRSAGADADL